MPRSRASRWGLQIAAVSVVLLLSLSMSSTSAWADTDPPSRVARLSYLGGDVSMQPGGLDDWTEAKLNRPLTTSDRLWTAKGSRAELQIGNSTLRLNGETSFTLASLNDRMVQVQLAQGALNVHIWKLYDDETFEVDTPNFTVNLLRSGDYRIDVDSQGDTSWITVHVGTAQASGSGQSIAIQPRQQVKFSGGSNGTYDVAGAPALDGFDEWALARDRRQEQAKSAQYVPRDLIGYDDLDDYGTWRTYDAYGPVWVPRVVIAGWAPYRYGHWEYIGPWGWTWIDDAPWGFAPFHYGRWVYAPFGWAWVPGPRYYRPHYAPALVAWVGGRNWGAGLSFGGGYGVGWLPLGPREVYVPWYRASRNYWSNVNVHNTYVNNTYITNIYNVCKGDCDGSRQITHINYRNREHGMTAVSNDAFVHSRPVGKFAVNLTPDMARRAPVRARVDAQPGHDAILGGAGRPIGARPPERAFERPLVMKNTPPKPVRYDSDARAFGPVRGDSPTRDVPGGPARAGDNSAPGTTKTVPKPPARVVEMQGGERSMPGRDGMRPEHPGDRGSAGSEARHVVPRPERTAEPGEGAVSERGARPDRIVPKPPARVVEMQGGERSMPGRDGMRPEHPGDRGSAGSEARHVVPRPPERTAEPGEGAVSERGAHPDRIVPKPPIDRPVRDNRNAERSVPQPGREVENRVPKPEREVGRSTWRGEREGAPGGQVPKSSGSESHVRRAPVEPIRSAPAPERQQTTVREAPHSAPRPTAPPRGAEVPRSAPHAEHSAAPSGGAPHRER